MSTAAQRVSTWRRKAILPHTSLWSDCIEPQCYISYCSRICCTRSHHQITISYNTSSTYGSLCHNRIGQLWWGATRNVNMDTPRMCEYLPHFKIHPKPATDKIHVLACVSSYSVLCNGWSDRIHLLYWNCLEPSGCTFTRSSCRCYTALGEGLSVVVQPFPFTHFCPITALTIIVDFSPQQEPGTFSASL